MSTSVRRMLAADIPELCRLDYGWKQHDFAYYEPGSKARTNALVATESGRIVGHCCYEFTPDAFHVARLFVAPMARRRGHGRALVGELRSFLKDDRQTRIVVHCGEESADMRVFLNRIGFLCRRNDEWGAWYVTGLVPPAWRLKNRIAEYVEK